jgi:hypothetical protein
MVYFQFEAVKVAIPKMNIFIKQCRWWTEQHDFDTESGSCRSDADTNIRDPFYSAAD